MSEICPGEVAFSDGQRSIFDTVQILPSGALRTATLVRWHDQLDGWCESEVHIMFHPVGSWTSVTAPAATGTLFVEDTQYMPHSKQTPELRQPHIKRLASRITAAEASTIATRYLIDNHGFSEIHAQDQAHANLTDPTRPLIMVRLSKEDRRKAGGSNDRIVEFRYLTPPASPPQSDPDQAVVDAAFPPR